MSKTLERQLQIGRMVTKLETFGLSRIEIFTLVRIERTLQRWGELECGNSNDFSSWSIERDETTDKPFMVYHPYNGKSYRRPVADKERGALRRLKAIMDQHPSLWSYHQGDPRGAALYVGLRSELRAGDEIDSVYSSRGVCVSI